MVSTSPEGGYSYSIFNTNSVKNIVFQDNITIINDYAFAWVNLKTIEIPNSVIKIGDYAFSDNYLKSIEIPNSVTKIGDGSFQNNQLINIEIPNSVTTIGNNAFWDNDLKIVKIGSGIQYIEHSVFKKNSYSNPNLESITFTSKTCEEIKNIEASETDTTKSFPWLDTYSPYYQEGYKVDIIGTDGVCNY